MKNTFWKIVDKTIILLNKMESLLSLVLIFTGTSGYITENDFWIKTSYVLIITLGLVTILLLSVFMYRRINDLAFVRSYFHSKEWENTRKSIDFELIKITGDSNKSEIRRAQYLNNAVLSILEIRRNMTYNYIEKLVRSLIDDENLKDFKQ